MKGRRRKMNRTRNIPDPVERFMEEALKSGQFAPFYCAEHGKHFMLPGGVRPACPVCGVDCFTPEEWSHQNSPRLRRERRIQLLRNHLE